MANIFCIYQFSALVALFATYTTSTAGWQFYANICLAAVFIGITIFSLVLYSTSDFNYMGEFKYLFKWNSLDLKIYNVMIISRVIFGVTFAIGNASFVSVVAVIVVLFIMSLFFVIRKSYANRLHTARSIANMLLSIGILSCYLVLSIKGYTTGEDFYSKIPLIVIILSAIAVVMAIGFIIKDLI